MNREAGNQMSGSDAMVLALRGYGVSHIFGLCGDTSLPLYDSFRRIGIGFHHILTRDERSAAYMADVYARVSGRVGVCEGPSGGGATYILPGVAEANESSSPVLAITTDIATTSRGRFALTELDQEALFRPVTKWNRVIGRGSDISATVRAAFTAMTTGRPGAAHIGLPFDVQMQPAGRNGERFDPSLGAYPSRRTAPDPDAVTAALELIRSARSPIVICGGGVVIAGAEAELLMLAEHFAIPVATSVSGQGSIAEDHPLAVGVIGSNGGTPETREIVDAADLVIFIGCRAGSVTTERWCHPALGQTRVLHLDVDPAAIGANYPADVALVGDARLSLWALNAALGEKGAARQNNGSIEAVAHAKRRKFEAFQALVESDELPIRPERVIAELHATLDPDAVVIADPGTPCPYVSAYYEFTRAGRHFVSNRAHGALGYGLPGVVGAYFGRPGAKCVAIMGDGGFGFAVGELETIARLGLPVTLIVLNNATYGWIKAGQKSRYNAQYFSVDFSRTDHAAVAEAYGLKAWRVREPGDLAAALKSAVDCGGPSLVDIEVQPLHEARAPVSEWVA